MTIPTSPASSIAGIVVAAGLSSRMGHGTSKLLLPWTQDGRTIVETTVGVLLASVVDQVLIVVGYARQRLLGTLESLPICPVIRREAREGRCGRCPTTITFSSSWNKFLALSGSSSGVKYSIDSGVIPK